MSELLESVNKRDFDRRISEVVEMLKEKQLYGTISLIKDLKYYLDLSMKEKTSYNCQCNSNSRENEPCCRCDNRQTNADRIRNMSDEELANFLDIVEQDGISSQYTGVPCDCCCEKTECSKCWEGWLQSEVE
nr:MAG TPA: hypothetical protein [Caudoviricetes sp.]